MAMDTNAQINEIIEKALRTSSTEEAMAGFIKTTPDHHKLRIQSCLVQFGKFFRSILPEMESERINCIQGLVNVFHKQKNIQRINFVCDMIRCCLDDRMLLTKEGSDGVLMTKPVLDHLCRSEHLKYNRCIHWCKTCDIIGEYIKGIDYKGCRDILHVMLSKVKLIPQNEWKNCQDQFMAVVKLLDILLDPEECLLPGYHAVNEIRQYLNDVPIPPGHWTLVGKFSEFVDRFRATAAMVTTTGRSQLLPVVYNFPPPHNTTWRLEQDTLRFHLRGQLPYDKVLYQKQSALMQYVLEQPYSREMVCHILNLQKQQKHRLDAFELELVDLVVNAMRQSDDNLDSKNDRLRWQHLSSQVIYFVLFAFASLPNMVETLYKKVSNEGITSGRDHLMWVLLQYISGSIQKYSVNEFLPVIKLIDYLYTEKQPQEIGDLTNPVCTHKFAAVSILIHINKKIQNENRAQEKIKTESSNSDVVSLQECAIPTSLQKQHEYLLHLTSNMDWLSLNDFKIALVCNAFSTATEIFNAPITMLVDSVCGDGSSTMDLPGNCVAFDKILPLSMEILDSLTVHTKMSMIQQMVRKIISLIMNGSSVSLAPAMVETYNRLLVYLEIDSLGVKGLLTQVMPSAYQKEAWGVLNTLLEVFSFRLHHIQPQYRIQLLTNLQSLAAVAGANQNQLHMSIESTTFRMITALNNSDVKPLFSRFSSDQKPIISQESEELNRVLILTLARSIHITGAETISNTWFNDILKAVMLATPHKWADHTLRCFPKTLQSFYQTNQMDVPNSHILAAAVDNDYSSWEHVLSANTAANSRTETELDAIAHFSSHNSQPYFLCLLWKVLVTGKDFTPSVLKIVRQIKPHTYSSHIRIFADYLVHEFYMDQGKNTQRYLPILVDIIWKYNLVMLDQLILCLALRCYEGDDNTKVAFFILQYLLMHPQFYATVHKFAQENPSLEHWKVNMHHKHMEFHKQHPEKFFHEGLRDSLPKTDDSVVDEENKHLPVYFGNIALRFLPILDLVIHRTLELDGNNPEKLLDHFGALYKLHERPITYVFNTLHYYESILHDKPLLKKKLVATIIASMNSMKPSNWALTEDYLKYIKMEDEETWKPKTPYFRKLVKRLVDTIADAKPSSFPSCDWRFNEFTNMGAHALHITCVELMALPISPQDAANAIISVALQAHCGETHNEIISWMNSVALILTTLPEVYWKCLNAEIKNTIQSRHLMQDAKDMKLYPYELITFSDNHISYGDLQCTRVLALTHIVWHHMGIGHLSLVPQFLKDELMPLVVTELQLLYIFNLIGPYLPRFQSERTRCMLDVCNALYDMLLKVSNKSSSMRFCDEIADFLYHIKYMHVGTIINEKVADVISHLKPSLQCRLKFLTTQQIASRPVKQEPNL